MSETNLDSSDCLARLHKIAEELPSGVREDEMKSLLPLDSPQELFTTTNDTIVNASKEVMSTFWSTYKVSEKLQELNELKENSPTDENAWRPTTGEADTKPIYVSALKERKKILEEEIRKTREQSDALRLYIQDCKKKLEQQIKELNSLEATNIEKTPSQ